VDVAKRAELMDCVNTMRPARKMATTKEMGPFSFAEAHTTTLCKGFHVLEGPARAFDFFGLANVPTRAVFLVRRIRSGFRSFN